MKKILLALMLVLIAAAFGLGSAPAAQADTCVTHCSPPNACGYVCCFEQCCNRRCIDLDCAPPPPCGGEN